MGTGGADGPGGAGVDASSSDASNARRYALATTGAQLVVSGPGLGLQLTEANVASDADVYAIHLEFYGLPWDAFETKTARPAEWLALMTRLRDRATAASRPVFLSLTMLDGQRASLAPKTIIEDGQVKSQDGWAARCYDFGTDDGASKRDAYLRYVAYMVELFRPAYLNVAVEVNLFFENCPQQKASLVDVANLAYDVAKKASPSTLVFPSIQIDHLYGYSKDSCPDQTRRDQCFDSAYRELTELKRDRFAMSSYPFMNGFSNAAELPEDWFSRGAARAGEIPLVAETGWLSTDLVARAQDNQCLTVFSNDEAKSAAYLRRVLDDADTKGMDLVTWWSDRDLVTTPLMTDCPCSFDDTWCAVLDIFRGSSSGAAADRQFFGELLLKAFGTMGLRDYTGIPKPSLWQAWEQARSRPLAR
jgi:hypothetical protein